MFNDLDENVSMTDSGIAIEKTDSKHKITYPKYKVRCTTEIK